MPRTRNAAITSPSNGGLASIDEGRARLPYPPAVDLPGILVQPEWLRTNLQAPGLAIADCRWVPGGSATDAFAAGHIPGAVLFDADSDLAAPAFTGGPGRHPLPSPETFATTLSNAGIGDDTAVVAYDDAGGSYAARLWWMLDALGHTRVALLDGSLAGWGAPLEIGVGTARARGRFTPRPWPRDRIADAEEVASVLDEDSAVVLDARAPERYRGEVEPIDPVAGHIPGAMSAPWAGNLDPETGRFLPPAELRNRYLGLGVDAGGRAISQCGSGLTACHDVLALRIAGFSGARLYEGSWSDWVSDPARSVATGPDPGRPP
jgi:thiosulfate/3-mercaptopyruvate sulfurtransferase